MSLSLLANLTADEAVERLPGAIRERLLALSVITDDARPNMVLLRDQDFTVLLACLFSLNELRLLVKDKA